MEPVEHFDDVFAAVSASRVYRDAVHATHAGLPHWLVPFSITNGDDLEWIARELGIGCDDAFADVGCGIGGPTLWVAEKTGASGVGVDFSAAAVSAATALAEERQMAHRVRFVVADAAGSSLPDAAFAGVMSIDAVMFIDPEAVAREMARLLKPGGAIVVRATESRIDPFLPTLVRDYRPVFESAGFVITTYEDAPDHEDRSIAFFRALCARSGELRVELGPAASLLLDEAANALAKAGEPPRVRTRRIVARKTGSPTLETARLRLESLASRHADGMLPILRDRTIYRYMPDTMPASIEKLRERYVWLARGASPDGAERWLNWIVFVHDGAAPIGFMQATVLGSNAWVGYVLRPSVWGNGYAREALRAIVDFLASTGVRRIMASIDPANTASRGVVEALDFARDETRESQELPYAGGGDVIYSKIV